MYSFQYPKMFSSVTANLTEDRAAIASNLNLLLHSVRKGLFGDPAYGTDLIKFIYQQNNVFLKDVFIDEIYTSILMFMPQIVIERKDINVIFDGVKLIAQISCKTRLDQISNLFEISLITEGD